MKGKYCVFHIPTAQFIMCHYYKEINVTFLLEPGVRHDYDSSSRLFRGDDPDALLYYINRTNGIHYFNRCQEEFEIQLFNISLIISNNLWREENDLS